MLFGREYMPEGAGISPDTPRKKGAERLWEILSRDLDGIFLSGALALLACAPAAILAGIALWLGFLPRTALSAVFQLGYWLLMAAVIPRCAFIFLLTGLWGPTCWRCWQCMPPLKKACIWKNRSKPSGRTIETFSASSS